MIRVSCSRALGRVPLCRTAAAGRRSVHYAAPRRFDQKRFEQEYAASKELFAANADAVERILPREYAETVAAEERAKAIMARADAASAARDSKALDAALKEIEAESDATDKMLEEHHMRMGLARRTKHREHQWAETALQEGRTTEAYGLHPDAGAIGSGGILEKYGVMTVAGFAAAIAVGKGIYLPTEETLVVLCFSGFIGTAYVALREQTTNDLMERSNESLKEHQAVMDRYINAITMARDFYKDTKAVSTQLTEVAKYFRELQLRYLESRPRVYKTAFAKGIEERFARLEAMERNQMQQMPIAIADKCTQVVSFLMRSMPIKIKQYDVDGAIARLAGKKTDHKDLVRMVYERAVARMIRVWADLRDREFVVPEDVRQLLQERVDAQMAPLRARVQDPTKMDLEGLVISKEDLARAKASYDRHMAGGKVPRSIRFFM